MIVPSDVAAAALAKWAAASLDALVPGGLHAGRLVSPRPAGQSYAQLAVTTGRPAQWYTEGAGPQAPYLAFFSVTVSVYGQGDKAVGDLLGTIGAVLGTQDWAIAGGTLFHVYLLDGFPTLEEDPAAALGEDVWVGKLSYEVGVSGIF